MLAEQATLDTHVANRILAALNIPADGATYTYNLAQNGNYAMWTSSGFEFNIYWTSDFSETLIAFMGGNVTGTVTPPDAPETVTLTYRDNSTNDITATVNGTSYSAAVEVEKGKAVTIELSATVDRQNSG